MKKLAALIALVVMASLGTGCFSNTPKKHGCGFTYGPGEGEGPCGYR